MLKPLFLVFSKSFVGQHVRRLKSGKVVTVGPYYDKRTRKGMEHVHAEHGHDVSHLDAEKFAKFEQMHREQHLLHHYHGHALRKRIAEHAEAIRHHTEAAKAHRDAGREVEATQAVNRALKRKSDLLRHQKELAEVDAKVAGIGAMMGKMAPGAGQVQESTEDSHKQYVDKMGSRWKASPRSPAKVTIPPAVEQSLMRLLGGFRSYAEGLERARATDQQFNGDGRYANEYAQNNKDRLEASEAFLAAKLGSIVNAANRAAAEEFIAKHRPDTNLTAHEQGFFGAKPADKKDEAIQAAVDHLKEDATQQDIPAKEKREDAALVAKLEGAKDAEPKATGGDRSGVGSASGGISAAAGRKDETILASSPSASDDSSIAQAVGSGKDSAPQEGEVNAEGLVFRGGRWHRDGAGQKPEAAKTQQSTPAGDDSLDPNSPNYRYRDTGVIEGARKFNVTDAFRRAVARGQLVRSRDIDWEEVETNPRRAAELITKSNLFGKVDWEALKEGGMEPGTGFLVDRVYASIATAPEDDPQKRQDYAFGIGSLRDRLETCKTPDELQKTLVEIRDEMQGIILSAKDNDYYKGYMAKFESIMEMSRQLEKQKDALAGSLRKITNAINAKEWEQGKRTSRGWKADPALAEQIEELKVDQEKAIQKWQAFQEEHPELQEKRAPSINGGYRLLNQIEEEAYTYYDLAEGIRQTTVQHNLKNNSTTRAWLAMGPKFVSLLSGKSESFAGHRANVRSGSIKDWSWAEKGPASTGAPAPTQRGAQFQLQVADKIERIGGTEVKVDSTLAIKDRFGLRDVQSGNWVLKDQQSAQWHVQQSAQAFADLADLLGVDPKRVAFNGRLALAFGARGTGNTGFGGAAKAHYEPVERVINITKMQGGGSLAHEWFHSLDNLADVAHGGTGGADAYATETPGSNLPPNVRAAFADLADTMRSGTVQARVKIGIDESDRQRAKTYLAKPTGTLSVAIAKSPDLESAIAAVDQHQARRINALAERGKRLPVNEKKNYDAYRRMAVAHFIPVGETSAKVPTGPKMSSFAIEARKLDAGKSKLYWSSPREMAARAFSAWCEDRLADQGRKSDYLSAKADNKYYFDPLFGQQYPFPEGEERKRINQAFDRLFEALREQDTFAKAMAYVGERIGQSSPSRLGVL